MFSKIIRQIVLDTETTGINKLGPHYENHRIIEIGAVEIINRRLTKKNFHVYLKPDRLIDFEAFDIHGISDEFLIDQPTFSDVAEEFFNFIYGSELIIHNAPFDIGFIDHEFAMLNRGITKTEMFCNVIDSLILARKIFPGKRNNLNALCNRYLIDNSKRIFHSALLDAEILAKIFLLMTSGQTIMNFIAEKKDNKGENKKISHIQKINRTNTILKIIYANNQEMIAHKKQLNLIKKTKKFIS